MGIVYLADYCLGRNHIVDSQKKFYGCAGEFFNGHSTVHSVFHFAYKKQNRRRLMEVEMKKVNLDFDIWEQ